MKLLYKNGISGVILRVKILDATSTIGAGLTGLAATTTSLKVSTIANNESAAVVYTGSNLESISALGTFATPTSGKCRFKEVDATNHPGLYEIQLADARFAVSAARNLIVSVLGAANAAQVDAEIQLSGVDLQDATRGGMSASPNANASAAGGLITAGNGANQISPDGSGNVTVGNVTVGNYATGKDPATLLLVTPGSKLVNDASGITVSAMTSTSVAAIWNALTSGFNTAGSVGKKLKDWTLGTDGKALLSTDAQAGVTIPTVTNVTNAPSALADIEDLLQADRIIDTTANPWALVLIKKGSGLLGQVGTIELLRQKLYDVNGAAITNANTILGRSLT